MLLLLLYNFMEVVDAYLRRATILVLALKWLLLKSRKWFTGIYNSIMLAMCQTENYNSIWVNVSNLSYTLSRHSLTQITLPYEDRNGQHRVHPSIKFLSIRVITHSHGGAICNGQLFDDKRQDDVASNRELTGADCRILLVDRSNRLGSWTPFWRRTISRTNRPTTRMVIK